MSQNNDFMPLIACESLKNEYHINHPSCHNELAYLTWRYNQMKIVVDYELQHPFPRFKRVRPCNKEWTVHLDHISCCNLKEYHAYKNWYNNVIVPIKVDSNISF